MKKQMECVKYTSILHLRVLLPSPESRESRVLGPYKTNCGIHMHALDHLWLSNGRYIMDKTNEDTLPDVANIEIAAPIVMASATPPPLDGLFEPENPGRAGTPDPVEDLERQVTRVSHATCQPYRYPGAVAGRLSCRHALCIVCCNAAVPVTS